jgi:hypothetical protein
LGKGRADRRIAKRYVQGTGRDTKIGGADVEPGIASKARRGRWIVPTEPDDAPRAVDPDRCEYCETGELLDGVCDVYAIAVLGYVAQGAQARKDENVVARLVIDDRVLWFGAQKGYLYAYRTSVKPIGTLDKVRAIAVGC